MNAATVREYDRAAPSSDETETATSALGCFWGPDAQFGAKDGVVRTRVGYAGGTDPGPTYRDIGDHTEVVQVDYDPDRIGYDDLLAAVFESHSPHHQPRKTQYQHIVFHETSEQRDALDAFLDREGLAADAIETRIESLDRFYPAENYHQKFRIDSKRWLTDPFEEAGYDEVDVRESPAAAKLNAYAAGHDLPDGCGLVESGVDRPA
jgi:peptide-methionine (S)-S-oxide reductase